MEPVVRNEIEGLKWFASLRCTLLKIFIEHLFPARRVDLRSVRNYTVEIKQDRVVSVTVDRAFALGLSHRSLLLQRGITRLSDNRLNLILATTPARATTTLMSRWTRWSAAAHRLKRCRPPSNGPPPRKPPPAPISSQ